LRWKTILMASLVSVLVLPGVAFAGKGPGGSTESSSNQVKCGHGTAATPVGVFYVGTKGIEICSSDNKPPDGRIIVTPSYIAIDGDASNPGQSSGFIRFDKSGPSCGDSKHHDGTKKGGSCVPKAP
jgi:hypothetical protein